MKFFLNALLSALLIAFLTSPAAGQDEGVIPVKVSPGEITAPAGGQRLLSVIFEVPPEYHLTSRNLGLFYVEIGAPEGVEASEPIYPEPVLYEGTEVFKGQVEVTVKLTISEQVLPDKYDLNISAGYQICGETGAKICYFPQTYETEIKLKVVSSETLVGAAAVSSPESPAVKSSLEEKFTAALNRGSILVFLLVFIAGILTSFTPCVYPVIPITVGYIGAKADEKKLSGFFLSLFLVLGLATVYSILGMLAAATGSVFGSYTQHPAVIIVIAAIFAAMGASMLGLFDITIPASLQSKMQTRKKGFLGAYLVGIATGIIAAPCVGPVLVALLTWVARTGNLILGFLLLFTFALGMGLLFIVIGTFAGALSALPGSGKWMVAIKKGFGVILIGGAIFFLKPLFPESLYHLLWGVFLICAGVFMGALNFSAEGSKWGKALGIIIFTGGILFFLNGFNMVFKLGNISPASTAVITDMQTKSADWIVNDVETAFTLAEASGSQVLMDFYADWCAACEELEEYTWSDPQLLEKTKDWIFLKIDLTAITPELKEIQNRFEIRGMPTVIFFNSKGDELARFSGFKPANEVLALIETVKK